jgi:hypothetical protein
VKTITKEGMSMSNRYSSVVVIFEDDISEEYAELLVNALRCFKGVLDVKPKVADMTDLIAESRAAHEVRQKVYEALSQLERKK